MKTLKFISKTSVAIAIAAMITLVYSGCKKTEVAPTNEEQSTVTKDDAIGTSMDNNVMIATFDDGISISDQANALALGLNTNIWGTTLLSCANVSKDNGVITVDLGSTACL